MAKERINDGVACGKTEKSWELALPVVSSCRTYKDAAKELNCSENQIYAWLRDPEFKAKVDKARREIVEGAMQLVKGNLVRAASALVELLDDENPAIRLRAANDVISHCARFIEHEEFEKRLVALEKRATA